MDAKWIYRVWEERNTLGVKATDEKMVSYTKNSNSHYHLLSCLLLHLTISGVIVEKLLKKPKFNKISYIYKNLDSVRACSI